MKTIITTMSQFNRWTTENWSGIMAIDFETTSLDYLDMKMEGFSLYNGKNACYVPKSLMPLDYEFCLNKQTFIMHNAPFDMGCMKKFFGIDSGYKVICTLTGAKLVDERRGKRGYGLKKLAKDWLGRDMLSYDESVGTENFADYCMEDSIAAWDLWKYEKPKLTAENLMHLFTEIEMPFQFVLRDLHINGVLVDREKLSHFDQTIKENKLAVEAEMLEIFGLKHFRQQMLFEDDDEYISPINFGSRPQLVDLIELRLGFTVDSFTRPSKTYPKGQKSVDKQYLLRVKGKHKFFGLLSYYRKLETLYDTFIHPCSEFIKADNRIRPSWHLVRTGRLSCSQPNLTNLPNPKREKLDVNYREIFVPEEGNVFVKADFSGQELRNLAEVSGDRRMKNAFNNNIDLHLLTANYIFGLDLSDADMQQASPNYSKRVEQYSQLRYKAKNGVNFPIVYGTTATGISQRLGVLRAEAQRWIDGFFKLYPAVKIAIEETRQQLQDFGYTATLMGRRRRFDYNSAGRWEKERILRQAFNHRIQGLAADQAKIAAKKVWDILPEYGAKIVLWIHDELVFEVSKENAERLAKCVKNIMESAISLSVPVEVDVSIVSNFGE